ncbi:hypothetical protein R3P38DRAFT_2972132 [Favolaschia claudopus]|uniref:Uncharacterized protein n=1 Tax=Favolaschia claudopus TaxID=2862362 RepID=A0AAW0B461_9AGAR
MAPKPPHKRDAHKPKGTGQCLTLLEDEITRCSEPATHGYPIAERCRVHHQQYCTMTKKYKEAQKFVDTTFDSASIPTKSDISEYDSVTAIFEKSRMMKRYVNAIRAERTGRQIHHGRFFLKVDSGHKMRLNILEKRMVQGVEIRDALETKAMQIHLEEHPAKDWIEEFRAPPDEDDEFEKPREGLISPLLQREENLNMKAAVDEDDDIIELKLRHEREKRLCVFESILDPDKYVESLIQRGIRSALTEPNRVILFRNTLKNVLLQYTRRLVLYNPKLLAKAHDKVSLKDLIMDDDFGDADLIEFAIMFTQRLRFGLKWWKDSWTEALAMNANLNATANMGDVGNRFKVLGGWIFNKYRDEPASNKVWYHLLNSDTPEKDTENRYVRICNTFDELHTFMVFTALLLGNNNPSFCSNCPRPNGNPTDSRISRNHLSLCGVFVADIIGSKFPATNTGPVPSSTPAKAAGCITWAEGEFRAYMFGAIRNESDDFTVSFLRELRARPDLFAVVTRSESDPPLKLESFGDATYQIRMRTFEAPFAQVGDRPAGRGPWKTVRSPENVLWGDQDGPLDRVIEGYLSARYNNTKGEGGRPEVSFFYHKRFPVKYFLILGASPSLHIHDLVRQVAWAALKACGLVGGQYDEVRYFKASDVLFAKHARERLSFLPEDSFSVTKLG